MVFETVEIFYGGEDWEIDLKQVHGELLLDSYSRVVHVVLVLKASRQYLIIAGGPFWDNRIKLRGVCIALVEYQLEVGLNLRIDRYH